MERAPRWKIWHPEYVTEECSCVHLKSIWHLEWNTPGSPRWYIRRIINGCYRDFVDTNPCRWEKPKPENGRKPNWNENRSTSRIEYQVGGNYIHYSLTWCHRQVLCLSLFTLMQRLPKMIRTMLWSSIRYFANLLQTFFAKRCTN